MSELSDANNINMDVQLKNGTFIEDDQSNLLVYHGTMDTDSCNKLFELVRNNINYLDVSKKVRKKTLNTVIEMVQNLIHHVPETEFKESKFYVEEDNVYIRVTSGNVIDQDRWAKLEEQLTSINTLGEEEFDDVFTSKIAEEYDSGHGGGGVGLLSLFKYSKQKLMYKFIPVDNQKIYFWLQVLIQK